MINKEIKIFSNEILWSLIISETISSSVLNIGEYISIACRNKEIIIKSSCSFKLIASYNKGKEVFTGKKGINRFNMN